MAPLSKAAYMRVRVLDLERSVVGVGLRALCPHACVRARITGGALPSAEVQPPAAAAARRRQAVTVPCSGRLAPHLRARTIISVRGEGV
jgi:hypothetical protein